MRHKKVETTMKNDKLLSQFGAETLLQSVAQQRTAKPAEVLGNKVVSLLSHQDCSSQNRQCRERRERVERLHTHLLHV